MSDRPGRSLAVWAGLLIFQIVSYPPLFLLGVSLPRNPAGMIITAVFATVWFAIPFGSFFGARAGVRYVRRHPGNLLAWSGIVLNCLYLLFGFATPLLIAYAIHM
jgi:CDP-diglyceride synthetase